MSPIPCTTLSTVAALRRGDSAALFSDSAAMQRIRCADPHGAHLVRVEWDNGPGSRAHVRYMPATNPVQIGWR